jgi:hypothetical protein
MTDPNYSCSKSYSDADYALTFCPQPKNRCGQKNEIDFSNNVNVTDNISIGDMDDGDVCTYKIKSRGGSPSFMLKNSSTTDCIKMEIKYVEYNEYNINTTKTSESGNGKKSSSGRKQEKPSFDKPGRNASMGDAGKAQNSEMGQQKTFGRRKTSGGVTTEETTEERGKKKFNYYKGKKGEYEKENKEGKTKKEIQTNENGRKPKWMKAAFPTFEDSVVIGRGSSKQQRKGSSDDETTKADMGYGRMTKGEYNGCGTGKGTRKNFGSKGQGWDKRGIKDDNAGEDEPRTMLVTIRAKQNIQGQQTSNQAIVGNSNGGIEIEVASNEFTDTNAYSSAGLDSGAIKATLGLAAAFVTLAASF